MGEQRSDPHLRCVLGAQWTLLMPQCWACAGCRFCVARQGFGLQIPKKSYSYFRGQLLIHETSHHLSSLTPEPLSQAIGDYVLSWASQVLHWKKSRDAPFSVDEEKFSGFLLWSLKCISDLENWCKTRSPPYDLIFKGVDLIPRSIGNAGCNQGGHA